MPWNVTPPNISQGETNPLSGCVHSINFIPLALVVAIAGLVHSEVSSPELQVKASSAKPSGTSLPCAMPDSIHMLVTLGV
jgi:hypothetical protein